MSKECCRNGLSRASKFRSRIINISVGVIIFILVELINHSPIYLIFRDWVENFSRMNQTRRGLKLPFLPKNVTLFDIFASVLGKKGIPCVIFKFALRILIGRIGSCETTDPTSSFYL